ncbi:hypothetical protein [Parafrankia colletiae]|nr:hypothetical protein [Parafrankia colletiae]
MLRSVRSGLRTQDVRHHIGMALLLLLLELFVLLVVHLLVVHLLLIVAMFGRELVESLRRDREIRRAV